jgi:hypothetical protein
MLKENYEKKSTKKPTSYPGSLLWHPKGRREPGYEVAKKQCFHYDKRINS